MESAALLLNKKGSGGKPTNWTKISTKVPVMAQYGIAADLYGREIMFSGTAFSGVNSQMLGIARVNIDTDVRAFHPKSTMATSNHGMAVVGNKAYIILGDNGPTLPGRRWWWSLELDKWNTQAGYYSDYPMQYISQGRLIDAGDGNLLAFSSQGGAVTGGTYVQEMNIAANKFTYLASGINQTYMHQRGAVRMWQGNILMFGKGTSGTSNDTISIYNRLDASLLERRATAPIPPRANSTNFAILNGLYFMYGGTSDLTASKKYLNDLWSYNPEFDTWVQYAVTSQIPKGMEKAELLSDGNFLYLCGGATSATESLGDIWKIEI